MLNLSILKKLRRYPQANPNYLKAWDAADELLLEHMMQMDLNGKKILIINDQFGALSLVLQKYNPTVYTDSFLSYKAIEQNSVGKIKAKTLLSELNSNWDVVLIRIPKNLSYFEDILGHLSQSLHLKSELILGSMVKYLAKGCFGLLNNYIGSTSTSLAQKKARLVFCKFVKNVTQSPFPKEVLIENFEHPFVNHSNLFSSLKLDLGTRVFLNHIPKGNYKNILDLGCANGIIGIAAMQANPKAVAHFSDESKMAILSAEINFKRFYPDRLGKFYWTNGLEDGLESSHDLVLCNPPFHQGGSINSSTARQMFLDAKRVLQKGGLLRVIGNNHLGYFQLLRQIFGNCKSVFIDNKFTILDSIK